MGTRRLLLLVALVVVAGAFLAFDLGRFFSLEYFAAQRESFEAAVAMYPFTVALAYFVVYVVVTGLSLPGAAIMTLAGGALFGVLWGTVIVSFASTFGATLAFLVARFLLRGAVQKRFAEQLAPINRGINSDGAFYLFSLRLVPLFPYFMVNLVMGLTPIRTLTYFFASQLGMLPATVVFVYAGTQLASIKSTADIISPGLLGAFVLLAAFPWIAKVGIRLAARRRVLAKWQRPRSFDNNLLVIGGGSAGLIAALIAATVKAKVTLVERSKMGGDCLNTGCVPSKALITAGRVAKTLRESGRFGFSSTAAAVDFTRVMDHVRGAIATIEPNDSPTRYESLGVRVKLGEARFIDPWTVEVNGQRITARHIVVATGGRPRVPRIEGIDEIDYLTSDSVWELEVLPEQLLVLGSGPIGSELAQAFARLGSQVSMVNGAARLLPKEDADVAAVIQKSFEEDGIKIHHEHRALAVRREGSGGVLVARGPGGEVELPFTHLLVAIGREPVTDIPGLDALGLRRDERGSLWVNEYLQTSMPTIYACGDVIGPYLFTHMASHQAYYATTNALFGSFWRTRANYSVVPWCTYTEPEVARVGLSEEEARQRSLAVEVSRFEFQHNDRAIAEGECRGFVKVLTPASGSDRVLGVTIVGPHAGELLAEWTLAMTHGIGLKKLMATIHVYPTLVEANKSAASSWRKQHAPEGLLRWAGRFHAVMRGSKELQTEN